MNKGSLSTLKCEYRDNIQESRDEDRKATAQMELNLIKDVKSNKMSSCKYISDKRNTKENINSYLNEAGDLITVKTEKSDVLNAFYTSVFTCKTGLQEIWFL